MANYLFGRRASEQTERTSFGGPGPKAQKGEFNSAPKCGTFEAIMWKFYFASPRPGPEPEPETRLAIDKFSSWVAPRFGAGELDWQIVRHIILEAI